MDTSKISVMTMTPDMWSQVKDHPRQRNTVEHAHKVAQYLQELNSMHLVVSVRDPVNVLLNTMKNTQAAGRTNGRENGRAICEKALSAVER